MGAVLGVVAGSVIGALSSTIATPNALVSGFNQLVNYLARFNIPPFDIVIALRSGGFIDEKTFLDWMRRQGFKDEVSKVLYELFKPRASIEDTIRALFYYAGHEVPHDKIWEWVRDNLKVRGYDDAEITKIIYANQFMPSLSDLLQWMAKEAFEDDIAKELGLDEELPWRFIEYGRRLGIPEEDLKRYWRAHWSMASWSQVAEAFHRARAEGYRKGTYDLVMQQWKKIWNIFYKQAEIPRFYRDMLTSITYSVITRVDARRMYEMGFLNDKELASIFIALGYTKEDAERMVQWIKYEVQRYGEEDLRGLTRSHVEKLYKLGLLNDKEYIDLMKKVGVGEETAQFLLAITKQEIYENYVEEQIKNIKIKYQKGLISKEEAYKELIQLQVDPESAGLYLAQWETAKAETARLLSKDDIKQALRYGVMNLREGYEYLRRLGYSDRDARVLLLTWGAKEEEVRAIPKIS